MLFPVYVVSNSDIISAHRFGLNIDLAKLD